MNIVHVIRSFDPQDGGPPAVVARLAAAQAALGHTVGVLFIRNAAASERARASFASIPGFSTLTLHAVDAGEVGAWLTREAPTVDVFHLHGVWDSILIQVAAAARAARKPYAVVPHGMLDPWCLTGQGFLKGLKKRLALAVTHRAMLRGAAFLHVLNRDEGELMAPLRLPPRTEVIPNGVFESEVSPLPARGTFRAKHPELGVDPYVLFLSRLHFKKGLDVLADAFAKVVKTRPNTRVVVAGPDDGEAGNFRERVRALGVAERTHLVGPLYGPEKLACFVDAAVFCLPSRQEGFSMAVTEALACGAPVVISDQCHFPEVEAAGAGAITPLSAEAVAAALDAALARTPEEAERVGRRGRELVMSRFTWPRIAEQTLAAYARANA